MLSITHTHTDGTTLDGSQKRDGVLEIVRRHGFDWKRWAGVHIPHSRDKDARRADINAAADALRAAGHEVTVEIDDTARPTAVREADRAERADARADRYAERADKHAEKSAAARAGVERITDGIPFGQPILMGHHSQRRAERDQERVDAGLRKFVDEGNQARLLAQRADAVGHHLAHRQDPRVTMRRIERLEAEGRDVARKLTGHRNNRGWVSTAPEPGSDYHDQLTRRAATIAEEIAHWRAELAGMADAGVFVAWGPEHFRKGDTVNVRGTWYPVRRVNKKSVSVPGGWGMVQGESSWNDTAPWDDVAGRRRDGMQLDTPNGEPWPVELAAKAARWARLVHSASLVSAGHDEESRREVRHVQWAQRIAHRLDLGAARAEVDAFQPDPDDVHTVRALHAAYLAIFDRLTAGELTPAILADLPDMPDVVPAWRMPAGEPQRVAVRDVQPGDIVRGVYNMGVPLGGGEGQLSRTFAGPVAEVVAHTGPDYSGERFIGMWCVVLTTGERREFKPWQPLAVHPAEPVTAEPVAVAEPVAEPVAPAAEPVCPFADLLAAAAAA